MKSKKIVYLLSNNYWKPTPIENIKKGDFFRWSLPDQITSKEDFTNVCYQADSDVSISKDGSIQVKIRILQG